MLITGNSTETMAFWTSINDASRKAFITEP